MGNMPPRTETAALLQDLEAVYMDPFISRVFDQVKTYNDLLFDEYVSDDEIIDIVNELNSQWSFLLGEPAVATGLIGFKDVDDLSTDGVPADAYYENQDVIFGGIVVRTLDTRQQGSNLLDEGEESTSTYELRIKLLREGIDSQSQLVEMIGSAAAGNVISLEFEQAMSPERARKWLEHFHPDVVDEIDTCLLNPSLEECESVMRLKEMVIDLSMMKDSSQDMIGMSKIALGVYVESLFDFDEDVPYVINASGECWSFNEYGAVEAQKLEGCSLAKVKKIVWQPGTDDSDETVRPLLDIDFLGTQKDMVKLHLLVPLIAIEDFASLRYDYFYGYPDEETKDSL